MKIALLLKRPEPSVMVLQSVAYSIILVLPALIVIGICLAVASVILIVSLMVKGLFEFMNENKSK
jgi:uncharacterized membrane protein